MLAGSPSPKHLLTREPAQRRLMTAPLVFVAKAQKIEMDKLEKAKKERTKVSGGRVSWVRGQVLGVHGPMAKPRGLRATPPPPHPSPGGWCPEQPHMGLVGSTGRAGFPASVAGLEEASSCFCLFFGGLSCSLLHHTFPSPPAPLIAAGPGGFFSPGALVSLA